MIGIYKITNKINNKSYIGQSIHCGKRLDEHYKGNQYIDQIIQQYGIQNFTFEILIETKKDSLSLWEDYYIDKYKTLYPNGYNKRYNCKEQERLSFINEINNVQQFKDFSDIDIFKEKNINENMRMHEAFEYKTNKCTELTTKQYLVYSYLVSVSKYNSKTDEYYVYTESLHIKPICEQLKISRPTWGSTIQKLYDLGYIDYEYEELLDKKTGQTIKKEKKSNRFYKIKNNKKCVQLSIDLINWLIKEGVQIFEQYGQNLGGNIVSVYCLLYYSWQCRGEEPYEISINQIKNMYTSSRTAKDTEAYRDMLGKFSAANLIEYTTMTKTIAGTPYTSYLIKNVRTELPEATKNVNIGEDDTSDIYKTLGTNTIDVVAIEKDKK